MSPLLLIPTRYEIALLPDAPDESEVLAGRGRWRGLTVALIGFGVVDAAAGAMAAFESHPDHTRVLLAGLGGTYDQGRCPVGVVVEIESFQLHGVGAGQGPSFIDPESMGRGADLAGLMRPRNLEPCTFRLSEVGLPSVPAVTVCAASSQAEHAAARRARYPGAAVEDMEGFAVARATRLASRKLGALRAISNIAGDRDVANWASRQAMARLAGVLERVAERYA